MKTSLIAFIIMVALIVLASNLPAELMADSGNLTIKVDNIVLAAPADTATPIFMPASPTPTFVASPAPTQSLVVDPAISSPTEPAQSSSHTTLKEVTSSFIQSITSLADQVNPAPAVNPVAFVPLISRAVPPTPTPTPAPTEPPPPPEAPITSDEGRSWSDYAGPSIWPDLQAPGPVGILAHPEDQINILLLGSDQRPNDSGFRTDTIQLLTINPTNRTVKMTSFPRDLYVNIPGYTMQRINTAFGWGGFEALAETMEYNFGVRPEYYMLINFRSFVDGVDSIGGITVDIGRDFCDHMDDWGEFCVSEGSSFWMNGKTALWYTRARYTTSDLDRGRRQQEVLEAAFKQLVSLNGLKRIPELYGIYKENVTTNIDLNLILDLLPVAMHLADSYEVSRYSIGRDQVYDWINYSGAMVLVPVRESVLEVMREAISEP